MSKPQKNDNTKHLDHSKFGLYKKIAWLHPASRATAMVMEAVRRHKIKYPIEDHDALAQLLEAGRRHCELEDGTKLTVEHAKKYMPKEFFPIEDEDAFLGRLFAAFLIGEEAHRVERMIPGDR
jgi:hypothetical protein